MPRVFPLVAPLGLLLHLLLGLPSAEALAAPSPQEVLADETAALRDLAMDDPEFVGRMDQYAAYAAAARDLSGLVQEYRPLLDDLSQLQGLAELGLLEVVSQLDPDLAFVGPLLASLASARELVDSLDAFSRGMTVLTSDLNQLMTAPALTLGELQAVRGSIPEGVLAIEEAARAYAQVRPALDEATTHVAELRGQLAVALDGVLQGMVPSDLSRELRVAIDDMFEDVAAIKSGLDLLADHAVGDVATLRRLEAGLREAEAHHAYALADEMLAAGELAQAEAALQLLVEMYPGSSWAATATAQLERGLQATGPGGPAGEARTGLLWLVLAGTVLVAAGFVAWSVRRERAEGRSAASS